MPGWFADQTAVVTGASSGIGWELGKVLASEGAKVGLVARRKDKLDALADEIRRAGGTAAIGVADVAEREQTVQAIHGIAAELGPVDLLVAGAGVGTPTVLDPPNTPDVEQMFKVNTLGVVYAIEAVVPEMLRRGRGHIAAISSIAAYKGLPRESGYCASKAAVNCYLEGLRLQLWSRGITVTTICPGFVKTPMTDHHKFKMPWLLQPDEAARRIARALKNKRKVYNFPWQMALLMRLTKNWAPDWMVAWLANRTEHEVPYRPIMS